MEHPRAPADPEEVVSFPDAVHISRNRIALTTCYAVKLRVSETVSLRPSGIDSQRMVFHVWKSEGRKENAGSSRTQPDVNLRRYLAKQ